MAVYFSIYLGIFASWCVARSKASEKILSFFWCSVLLGFVGTREWVGCDFGAYLRRFDSYQQQDFSASLHQAEPGFVALNYAVIAAGLDFMWVNLAIAALLSCAIFAFIHWQDRGLGLLALFFPILIVQLGMSGVRQAAAVAFLLFAWNSFVGAKRIWTLIWIIAAAQFHASALMFLPMVLLIGRRVSALTLALAVALALPAVAYFLAERAEVYQNRYIDEDNESLGAVFRVALTTITSIGFEIYRRRYREMFVEDFELMRAFSLFGFGTLALFVVSTLAAHRMNYYVMPVQLLILYRLPMAITGRRTGTPLSLVPFSVYALYMFVWFDLSRHASACFVPYNSYLF